MNEDIKNAHVWQTFLHKKVRDSRMRWFGHIGPIGFNGSMYVCMYSLFVQNTCTMKKIHHCVSGRVEGQRC